MCRHIGLFSIFARSRPFSFFSGHYAFLFLVFQVSPFVLSRLLHYTFVLTRLVHQTHFFQLCQVRLRYCVLSLFVIFPFFFLARVVAALGLDLQAYSPRSFRRGGATFAFECNVSAENIKFQSDYSSDVYLVYLELSPAQKQRAVNGMATKIHQLSKNYP